MNTHTHYFARLSTDFYPHDPSLEESRWITSEDANVEHLLDVFTSTSETQENHKSHLVILGPKIEALPNHYPSKTQCLHGCFTRSEIWWNKNGSLLTP